MLHADKGVSVGLEHAHFITRGRNVERQVAASNFDSPWRVQVGLDPTYIVSR